jgi:hypothetical protein
LLHAKSADGFQQADAIAQSALCNAQLVDWKLAASLKKRMFVFPAKPTIMAPLLD